MLLITYLGGANYHRFIKNCLLEAIKLFFFFILFAHFSTVISHFSFNKSPSLLFSTECIALCQRKNSSAFSPGATVLRVYLGLKICMHDDLLLVYMWLRRKITIIIHLTANIEIGRIGCVHAQMIL